MIYKNIETVEIDVVRDFADEYCFPHSENYIKLFCDISGGEPFDFSFKYIYKGQYKVGKLARIFSFDCDSDYYIGDAVGMLPAFLGNLVPFAITEDGDYLCYDIDNDRVVLCLIGQGRSDCASDIYNLDGDFYSADDFFNALE